MVQAWYQGGTSVVDFTDPAHPFEVAFFDRGPDPSSSTGGHWSSYWHNGKIYASEIGRGFDVMNLAGAFDAGGVKQAYSNARGSRRTSVRGQPFRNPRTFRTRLADAGPWRLDLGRWWMFRTRGQPLRWAVVDGNRNDVLVVR